MHALSIHSPHGGAIDTDILLDGQPLTGVRSLTLSASCEKDAGVWKATVELLVREVRFTGAAETRFVQVCAGCNQPIAETTELGDEWRTYAKATPAPEREPTT